MPAGDWSDLMMFRPTQDVLKEVLRERISQNGQWGEQNHAPFHWLSILGEEFGEAMKAANEAYKWKAPPSDFPWSTPDLECYRAELIQVAAVAVAMVECLDRAKWTKQKETLK